MSGGIDVVVVVVDVSVFCDSLRDNAKGRSKNRLR